MSRIYEVSSVTSDLTGGVDFNVVLLPDVAVSTLAVSIAQAATETSYAYTPALHPNYTGALTASYTVVVSLSATNSTNLFLNINLGRVNSAGTLQGTAVSSTEQQIPTATTYTFNFTNISLGTWTSTDRLRVGFIGRNAATMGGALAYTIQFSLSYIVTPFNARTFFTT